MTVTTVRQKILSYLRKKQSASAQEIAQVLQVTAADARHHLNLLAADGRVTPSKEHSAGRGRPARRYQLSNALRGENLSALLDAALEEWLGKLSPSKREQALGSLAKRIANQSTLPIGPLAKRLAATVEKLSTESLSSALGGGCARTAHCVCQLSLRGCHCRAPGIMSNGLGFARGMDGAGRASISAYRTRSGCLHLPVKIKHERRKDEIANMVEPIKFGFDDFQRGMQSPQSNSGGEFKSD